MSFDVSISRPLNDFLVASANDVLTTDAARIILDGKPAGIALKIINKTILSNLEYELKKNGRSGLLMVGYAACIETLIAHFSHKPAYFAFRQYFAKRVDPIQNTVARESVEPHFSSQADAEILKLIESHILRPTESKFAGKQLSFLQAMGTGFLNQVHTQEFAVVRDENSAVNGFATIRDSEFMKTPTAFVTYYVDSGREISERRTIHLSLMSWIKKRSENRVIHWSTHVDNRKSIDFIEHQNGFQLLGLRVIDLESCDET